MGQSPKWREPAARTWHSGHKQITWYIQWAFFFFFFWFLFVARQQNKRDPARVTCFGVSMYNWKLQSVTERSNMPAAPLALPSSSLVKTTESIQFSCEGNKSIAFQRDRKKMNREEKSPGFLLHDTNHSSQHKVWGNRHEMQRDRILG